MGGFVMGVGNLGWLCYVVGSEKGWKVLSIGES